MNTIDEKGLEKTMRLLVGHTNAKVAELRSAYDNKYTAMVGTVNAVARDMSNLSQTVNDELTQIKSDMSQNNQAVADALTAISNQITALGNNLNDKIDSLQQDFDNLDTQVNTINNRVTELSTSVDERFKALESAMGGEDDSIKESINAIKEDISGIKDAMGSMIVNIKPDNSGQFDVYHYDGTITHNTMVEEISSDEIDDITKI